MMHRSHAAAALLLLPPVLAQQQPEPAAQDRVALDLRITAAGGAGAVTIDRGRRDGLLPNLLVTFTSRDGAAFRGTVLRVDERSALVELEDKGRTAEPGTRGKVLVPRARLPKPTAQKPVAAPPQPDAPQLPAWQNPDQGYQPGMPLLAQVRPLQADERESRLYGRAFSALQLTRTLDNDLSNSYFRVGADAEIENPFGQGGALQFDLELDRRTDMFDSEGVDLLFRRLSYRIGGDRFRPHRYEFGRFLQHGVPELGVLDGVEFGTRLDNGHRAGASLGFLPVPDDDFTSGKDFQVAGYYQWVFDDREVTRLTAAAQLTWHNADDDRDLVLLKFDHTPLDDWRYHVTTWIDFYLGGEPAGSSGVDLTQAIAYAGRHWQDGSGLDFTLRHIRTPDILRWESWRLTPFEVRHNRYDRLDVNAWQRTAGGNRLHGNLNVWNDEQDTAAGGEFGLDVADLLLDHSRCDFTAFGTHGRFTDVLGGRVSYGRYGDSGSWQLLYELSHHDLLDRPADGNDLLQHRLAGNLDLYLDQGWSCTFNADAVWWHGEPIFSLGAYLQKTF